MKQNVIVIGGGAAGLSSALYLSRAGLAPLVFAGSPSGGQLMLTSDVENFPGQDAILGPSLIDSMRKQVKKFGTTIRDENVKSVDLKGDTKIVVSATGERYEAKAVIIATGAQALWLGLPSETRLRGKGVSACATCDGFFFKNKIVAVIGGGDSALEEALTLTKFATKVYIIHRREEFKASKIMQKRVFENEKIEVVWNAKVEEITGANRVEGIRLTVAGAERTIALNGVFVAIGHRPDTALFKDAIVLDQKGYVMTTATFALARLVKPEQGAHPFNVGFQTMTSTSGVFGAGDCVDHVYKQASTAAGMGVAAALDAERYLEEVGE